MIQAVHLLYRKDGYGRGCLSACLVSRSGHVSLQESLPIVIFSQREASNPGPDSGQGSNANTTSAPAFDIGKIRCMAYWELK